MSLPRIDHLGSAEAARAMMGLARVVPNDQLSSRRQLLLATYWLSLSFQGGALLGIAVPSHLVDLTFVAYYVQDVLHISQFAQGAAAIAGIAVLAALAGGVLTGWLSDWVGRKPLVSVASVLMAGALLAMAFVHQLSMVMALGVAFGLALGTYMAVDWALAIDVLPSEGFAAKDLGLWGISTNLPQTLAPLVGGLVLGLLAPLGAAVSYGVLFVGAALCAALSGVLIWRVQAVR